MRKKKLVIFKVGDRVRYAGKSWFRGDEIRTGTITKIYPGFDDEGLEELPYMDGWHAAVKVDVLPKLWPYGPRGLFSPRLQDLDRI